MDRINCYCNGLVNLDALWYHVHKQHKENIDKYTMKEIKHIVKQIPDGNHIPKLTRIRPLKIETFMQTKVDDIA